jgi:hypothetical protein
MMPIACPEKAAFGTVWTADNSQNGLQYAGRKGTGDLDQLPFRIERIPWAGTQDGLDERRIDKSGQEKLE